jgi:hypothetical protein
MDIWEPKRTLRLAGRHRAHLVLSSFAVALAALVCAALVTSGAEAQAQRSITAPNGVSITLDGAMGDWSGISGIQVPLEPIPEELNEEGSAADPLTATLKIATTDTDIYVLVAVPDGYSYDPDNHHLSPALGVEWLVDPGAGPGMGTLEPDFTDSGGLVDIWHWELDCGPGEISGGNFPTGNDPTCNLDDEYATATDEREDDDFENSMTGSWDHTARAQGIGADGTFVFEIRRPLQNGDSQDAQFTLGGFGAVALAYWDGDEGRAEDGGWSDAGHIVSALDGWIVVTFEAASQQPTPSGTSTPTPVTPPTAAGAGNAGFADRAATPLGVLFSLAVVALAVVVGGRLMTGRQMNN